MVHCIELQSFVIPTAQVHSYQQLHSYVTQQLNKPHSSLQIYYIDQAQRSTEIQSDADLISLKYINRESYYMFQVRIQKSQELIESEIQEEAVSGYLDELYSYIEQEESNREVKQAAQSYLSGLYSKIAKKQAMIRMKQMEEEQINKYLANLPKLMERSSRRVSHQTIKKSRFSPSKQERQLNHRQNHIDAIISRVLSEMMPMMIKELSSKIVQQIKQEGLKGERYNMFERCQNPQEL